MNSRLLDANFVASVDVFVVVDVVAVNGEGIIYIMWYHLLTQYQYILQLFNLFIYYLPMCLSLMFARTNPSQVGSCDKVVLYINL